MSCTACQSRRTELRIQSFPIDGPPTKLYEEFEEAYYSHDARGNLDLVFRSVGAAERDPSQVIRQIVHVNAFWKPQPGRTFAEATQCNATICYFIATGPIGIAYEGAGFISFKQDWLKRRLTGRIESGQLAPLRRIGKPKDLLGQAQVTGRFRARHNKSRVLALMGELRRQLGPKPEYKRRIDERGPR